MITYELLSTNRPPTQSEVKEAEERLWKLNQEIDAFNADLDDLEYRRNRLLAQRDAVQKVADAHRGVLSPFRTLPDDIIRKICIACAGLDGHRISANHMPLLLTHISRRFRHVALTTPEVWKAVHIDLTGAQLHKQGAQRHTRERIHVAWCWINKYSGALPLSICFRVEMDQISNRYVAWAKEMMDIIITCCSRWQSVDLSCPNELLRRVAALTPMDVPLLRSLAIYFPENDTSAFHSSQIFALSTLNAVGFMGFDSHIVQCSLIGARFTSLTLGPDLQQDHSAVSVHIIMQILQTCPLLITCHISVYYASEDENSDSSDIGKVYLDFLKSLTISEVPNWGQSILTGIYAPSLESLHLLSVPEDEILEPFLSRCPKIEFLELVGSTFDTSLIAWLSHCPQLARLQIGTLFLEADQLFDSFVAENIQQRVCPKLHHFTATYPNRISTSECLNKFLSNKDGSVPGLEKWTYISLEVDLKDSGVDTEATDALISSLKEAGVDINLSINYHCPTPPESVASN